MKHKQQVISRFFTPKPLLSPATASPACSPPCSSTVQWPPARTSASLRRVQHSSSTDSPSNKPPGHHSSRKRPSSEFTHDNFRHGSPEFDGNGGVGMGMGNDDAELLNPVDLERPEICSGATLLGDEETQDQKEHLHSESVTYKRRRKREVCLETQTHPSISDQPQIPPQEETVSSAVSAYWKPKENFYIPASDPARHKRFVKTLLASDDKDRLASVAEHRASSKEQYTPLEQQVVELKAKYKDVLLLIEVGYRYRIFGEDAEIAARVLGILAYNDRNFLTASIPSFRLHVHVRRLVEAGYKVGVVRQTETAAIKAHGANKLGPFARGLSALYTRATLEAAADLGGDDNHVESGSCSSYLMCITEQVDIPSSGAKSLANKQGIQAVGEGDNEAGAHDTTIGVVAVETATGDVMYGQFKDTILRSELEAHLLACSPAELLLASPLSSATEKLLMDFAGPSSSIRIERTPRESLRNGAALSEVLSFYECNEDSRLDAQTEEDEKDEKVDGGLEAIMSMPELTIQALALALRHLKQFGLEKVLRLGATFRPFADVNEMSLSSNTLQQLEILQNNTDGTAKGSLLWLMDHTHTAFGARLFRHWLTHPLRDRALILARLDAVSEIAESMGSVGGLHNEGTFPGSGRGGGSVGAASRGLLDGLSKGPLAAVLMSLKKVPDLERGITRIFHRTATAAEFVAVIQALITTVKQLQRLQLEDEAGSESDTAKNEDGKSSKLLKRLIAASSSSVVSEHASRLLSFLNKDAASAGDKHNLFVSGNGKFPMVEKLQTAVKEAEHSLDSLLPQYRKRLKIPNLQYLSVSGNTHLIEVPAAQLVPQNWVKVSSTKKTNRYYSPEVLQALDALALAKEELTVACNKAWDSFLADFASHYVDFRTAVHALAALDCLYSLAIVSRNQGYTRPEFVEQGAAQLWIECGRHPVLEATLQDGFVPNDTWLSAEREHCQIITGPNMGGKSCYIRQVALISIMAQVGSYVPAVSVKLHAFDAVYTRMGASDSIQRGSSTFLEELSEASTILQRATPYSLVIMDELGRGTSTHDGVAIAYATLEYLLKDVRCLSLFVTHYPKLADLRDRFPGEIGAYHVSYLAEASSAVMEETNVTCDQVEAATDKITFLYKLVEGVASRSFGLHVARLAEIPESCVARASTMAATLEREVRLRSSLRKLCADSGAGSAVIRERGIELGAENHASKFDAHSVPERSLLGNQACQGLKGSASASDVGILLCSVLSLRDCCEEKFSGLKRLQEQTISMLRTQ